MELDAGASGRLQQVMTSLARAIRLARAKDADAETTVDPALFEQREETALHEAAQEVSAKVQFAARLPYCSTQSTVSPYGTLSDHSECVLQLSPTSSVPAFLTAAEQLLEPVDAFFDKVFVMTEDEAVRRNRLALLR